MRLVAGEVLVVVSRCRGGFFCGAGALCTCYRNAVPPPVRDKHPLSRQLFNDAIKLAVGYKQNSGDFMDEVMRELEVSRALLAALVTPWGLSRGWEGRGGALWRAHTALGMTGESHSSCFSAVPCPPLQSFDLQQKSGTLSEDEESRPEEKPPSV